jgi:hypothetical protein
LLLFVSGVYLCGVFLDCNAELYCGYLFIYELLLQKINK